MIQNKNSIAILLATYNGERYLCEQLDSILKQSNPDFSIFIRDDGSTDNTPDIIERYKKNHNNIFILPNENKRLGPQGNFLELLHEVESKYYMFSDQDDIWLMDKIDSEFKKIQEIENSPNVPSLVFTNLKLVDGNLNTISNSFWKSIHYSPSIFNDLRSYIYINYVTGCTMMFNHKVKDIAFPVANYSPMHDWWITVCVYKNNGNIGYITEPQILYRKHNDNVTGNFKENQSGKSIKERIGEIFKLYSQAKKTRVISNFLSFLYFKHKYNKLRFEVQ